MQSFAILKVNLYENLDQPSIVALLIDHTLLKPEATKPEIARLCADARQRSFASVCVHPYWVRFAVAELKGSPVKVCTVLGFPLGANETRSKLFEADLAISQGATELDMVQNIGALRSGDTQYVYSEIEQLARHAHTSGALLKVILETCLLNNEEKVQACRLAAEARADFVKTSTGFSTGGATREDVVLMRNAVGRALGVKASGGIRSLAFLREMVHAGANRIGTSSGVQILRELEQQTAATEQSSERDTSY
jgi:deoxyribose-phosphate aldolase